MGLDEKERQMAELGRRDFYFLSRGILGKGKADAMTLQVHIPLCRFLQNSTVQNKLIVLPRSFLKSTLACIKLPIWLALSNPNIRVLVACNIIDNAMNHLRTIKHIFERNALFRHLYPELIPDIRKVQWSDHAVTVRRTGGYGEATFTAAGVGVNLVGTHYDVVIMDDILTAKKDDVTGEELAPSQLDIDRAIGWYKLAISLFDTPSKGLSFYIGTRWAIHDVVDYILVNDKSFVPYIQNVHVKGSQDVPVYPERFDLKALEQIKARQGPYIYASQYLLNPLPIELMVFKPDWIHTYKNVPHKGVIYTYIDPAISKSRRACKTAIITIECTHEHKIYVREAVIKKGMGVIELVDNIFRIHKKYNPRSIVVEAIAYQEAIGQVVKERQKRENCFFSIKDDKPTRGESKDERIQGLAPRFAAEQIFIQEYMGELRTELLEYQGVEKSRYVDGIDALAGAVKISTFPSEPEEVKASGWTMQSVMDHLRERRGYRLPFRHQLSGMGAKEEKLD
jgi:hypothetical protein